MKSFEINERLEKLNKILVRTGLNFKISDVARELEISQQQLYRDLRALKKLKLSPKIEDLNLKIDLMSDLSTKFLLHVMGNSNNEMAKLKALEMLQNTAYKQLQFLREFGLIEGLVKSNQSGYVFTIEKPFQENSNVSEGATETIAEETVKDQEQSDQIKEEQTDDEYEEIEDQPQVLI